MNDKKLKELPVDCLWDGLILSDDIYNHSGEVMLLPKGEVVIKSKLEKLLQFYGEEKSVMVHENTYLEITAEDHKIATISKDEMERQSGYEKMHQNIGILFHNPNTESWLNPAKMDELSREIAAKLGELDPITIFECMNIQRAADEELQRHSLNVAFLNGIQAQWLGMEPDKVRKLIQAGLLHDIGKTVLPEDILSAPRKLTENETEVVRMHPVYSDRLLMGQFDDDIRSAVRHHHERLDGQGYPDGIASDDIGLYARVTAISDIYDVAVSETSYKKAILPLNVLGMLYRKEFGELDRELVMNFIKHMRLKYMGRQVLMSDGGRGLIRYIPFNDAGHPIIQQGAEIRQTNDGWFCEATIVEYIANDSLNL